MYFRNEYIKYNIKLQQKIQSNIIIITLILVVLFIFVQPKLSGGWSRVGQNAWESGMENLMSRFGKESWV